MNGDDAFLLVFARCAGFMFRAPGFSHPSVPPPLRAGFAYLFALAIAHGMRVRFSLPGAMLILTVACEALLGAAVGVAASMLYDGAYAGGRLVDDYIGIKVDVPSAGSIAPSGFGRLWSQAFITGFFVLGGCGQTLWAFARSFTLMPPGSVLLSTDLRTLACALPAMLATSAFLVAAPAIAIAFTIQFALACVSRVVARFSVFPLSFTLVFIGVLSVTIVTLPILLRLSGNLRQMQWIALFAHG